MSANKELDMINKVLASKGPASKASSRKPADAQSQASRASRVSAAAPSQTSGKYIFAPDAKLLLDN